jgi:hypothetical protein
MFLNNNYLALTNLFTSNQINENVFMSLLFTSIHIF